MANGSTKNVHIHKISINSNVLKKVNYQSKPFVVNGRLYIQVVEQFSPAIIKTVSAAE
jgi:hypothetical protein